MVDFYSILEESAAYADITSYKDRFSFAERLYSGISGTIEDNPGVVDAVKVVSYDALWAAGVASAFTALFLASVNCYVPSKLYITASLSAGVVGAVLGGGLSIISGAVGGLLDKKTKN